MKLAASLAALICTVLVGTGAAAGAKAKTKTLHLTATVTKVKVTKFNKDSSNDTVTFDLRSSGKEAGQLKGSCNGPGAFFQCIQLSGHIKGVGSGLIVTVQWACSFAHPGCAGSATGPVSRNGTEVGRVTFKTTTRGATTVGKHFPVTIKLGNFCKPKVISPGVTILPKGC